MKVGKVALGRGMCVSDVCAPCPQLAASSHTAVQSVMLVAFLNHLWLEGILEEAFPRPGFCCEMRSRG